MMGHVSELAISGIVFSAIISIGLPVVLLILVKKRLGAKAGAQGSEPLRLFCLHWF